MRNYYPSSYKIERNRYYELKSFCRQYRKWKTELGNCYGLTGIKLNGLAFKGVSNPTANAAERAMLLQDKVDMVEKTCKEADPLIWEELLLNVTEGLSYDMILARGRPIHVGKSAFYDARMRFFWLLDQKRE